jgi:hypothetical protein
MIYGITSSLGMLCASPDHSDYLGVFSALSAPVARLFSQTLGNFYVVSNFIFGSSQDPIVTYKPPS